MVNFEWNENRIRMYYNASVYTGFHEKLANLIIPKTTNYKTLCDIGCGLGLVDLLLSEKLEKINCIDISQPALNFLRNQIKNKSIDNIKPILQDCEALTDYWDVIFISFF